ncbi:MAG: hypothetical protein AAF222_11775 [Pseudomonadota bacterium]
MIVEFGEDELRDYLHGVLNPARALALEAALATDETLEARLLALEPLSEPLGRAFSSVPDHARLERLARELPVQPQLSRVLPLGLVAALAAVIGLFLGNLTQPDRKLSWQEQVAVYQALYVAETVAPLEPSPASLQDQFARASERLGLALTAADYQEVPGLTLKRAQLLGFEGAPLVQIAFATETGAPIAFCILKTGETSPAIVTELSGLPTVHWSADGFGYMVIGDLSESELIRTAHHFGAAL